MCGRVRGELAILLKFLWEVWSLWCNEPAFFGLAVEKRDPTDRLHVLLVLPRGLLDAFYDLCLWATLHM